MVQLGQSLGSPDSLYSKYIIKHIINKKKKLVISPYMNKKYYIITNSGKSGNCLHIKRIFLWSSLISQNQEKKYNQPNTPREYRVICAMTG